MKERRPIRLSIPNAITLANLAVGYFAVMAAWNGQIGTAAVYILVCAVLDFLDGFAARLLKAYSELGKQLDSLADLVSFGVAPAAIAAVLLRNAAISRGWDNSGAVLLIIVAGSAMIPLFSALRLARFNISSYDDTNFRGLPVPADAVAFAAMGLIAMDGGYQALDALILHPVFILSVIFLNAWLMVSPVSMFSFKLKSYRPTANRWRYVFAAGAITLAVILKGYGLFLTYLMYILASLGMNLRNKYGRT